MNDKPFTVEKKSEFLEHLAQHCNVSRACEAIGFSRTVVYRHRENDPAFEHEWDKALKTGFGALEDEMHRRAYDGTLVATKNGVYKQYSDVLAIFLAKAHNPNKYMEKSRSELTGANGEPLMLSDDQIAAKLGGIMQAVANRRDKMIEAPQEELDEDDLSDLV